MLMVASSSRLTAPKGRPPLRLCPDDFDVIFVEQGRVGCETWYRASRITVNRWMAERGHSRLIKLRAAYVSHMRKAGKWMTRSTKLVEHREARKAAERLPIRDRRKVNPTLARHAAQHLRIVRNGNFIVSPAGNGEWWVGSRRMSAAQMVDLAIERGFALKANEVSGSEDDAVFVEAEMRIGARHGTPEQRERYISDLNAKFHELRGQADLDLGANWQDDDL